LIGKLQLSESEQSHLFQQGFQPSLWTKIERRLEVKIPDHYPGNPYKFEDIKEAATHVLRGTRIGSEEPHRAETVVDNTVAPLPATAIKGEDISTILEKFTQTLVSAMTAKPNANILHTHAPGEVNCHFCGGKGHILPNCPLVLKYIDKGKICRNQEGHVMLLSGAYVPRSVPSRWISEQVNE